MNLVQCTLYICTLYNVNFTLYIVGYKYNIIIMINKYRLICIIEYFNDSTRDNKGTMKLKSIFGT